MKLWWWCEIGGREGGSLGEREKLPPAVDFPQVPLVIMIIIGNNTMSFRLAAAWVLYNLAPSAVHSEKAKNQACC